MGMTVEERRVRDCELTANYRSRNRTKIKAGKAAWQAKNPDKVNAASRRYYHANKEKKGAANWASMIKRQYGITPADYDAMFEAQGGVCKSCGKPEPRGRRLDVDHDHVTKKVRGLLCNPCNKSFGLLKEDPDVLLSLYRYALAQRTLQ